MISSDGEGWKSTPQPWKSSDATHFIRQIGQSSKLTLSYSTHSRDRLEERDLFTSDVLYVLRRGFVYDNPEPASQPGLFKYSMQTRTPNSGNREVRIILIPDAQERWIKIVTVMWVDE